MNLPTSPLRLGRFALCRPLAIAALLLGSLLPAAQAAERIALLVGVGQYQDAKVPTLYGPTNDVSAMQQALIQHWDFKPENIRSLLDQQATHANILTELNRLQQRSKAGDHVLVYFSGHGTSPFDPKTKLPLPHDTGAFVPFDFQMPTLDTNGHSKPLSAQDLRQRLIVGQWHLRPVFEQLEKDRMLTVVMDSCYSGHATRSASQNQLSLDQTQLSPDQAQLSRNRNMQLPHEILPSFSSGSSDTTVSQPVSPYPYSNTISIVASKEAEVAADLNPSQTSSGKAHGLLTDLVLQVLQGKLDADDNNDGQISYAELRNILNGRMQHYQIPNIQTPHVLPHVAEDHNNMASRSLFGSEPKAVISSASNTTELRIRLAATSQRSIAPNLLTQIKWVSDASPADFALRQQGNQWVLATGDGDPIGDRLSLTAVIQRTQAEQWLRQLQQQLKSNQTLQISTTPAAQGNSFSQGDQFKFQLKSSQASHVILLNLNVYGQLQLLYPINASETKPLVANQLQAFPQDESIIVQPPYGLDTIIAIGLPQPIGDLDALLPMSIEQGVPITHNSVQALQKRLLAEAGSTFTVLQIRTYATRPDGAASSQH